MGVPNLDAMPQSELRAFWMKHQQICKRKEAAELVGDRRKGYTTLARNLGAYAINKATAMSCREKGNIQSAQVYERICDNIYAELPSDLKW